MTDRCSALLLEHLPNEGERTLLLADEHFIDCLIPGLNPDLTVITNRFDVHQHLAPGLKDCQFSDFDFSHLPEQQFDWVLFRVSKEKPVVFHVFNHAAKLLKPEGQLVITGEKNDGIKTYAERASQLLGSKTQLKKHGMAYSACIKKQDPLNTDRILDDKQYTRLRETVSVGQQPVLSKPGVFGWNKIDRGSELLMSVASRHLDHLGFEPTSVLDLGCGYGYLTLATEYWPYIAYRCATDNNAAALQCVQENARVRKMNVEVVAADAGSSIDRAFELILCNPPFHQGFKVDGDLTRKFLQQAQRLLQKSGIALFVVNQFIGLETLAQRNFSAVNVLHREAGFKIIELRR